MWVIKLLRWTLQKIHLLTPARRERDPIKYSYLYRLLRAKRGILRYDLFAEVLSQLPITTWLHFDSPPSDQVFTCGKNGIVTLNPSSLIIRSLVQDNSNIRLRRRLLTRRPKPQFRLLKMGGVEFQPKNLPRYLFLFFLFNLTFSKMYLAYSLDPRDLVACAARPRAPPTPTVGCGVSK